MKLNRLIGTLIATVAATIGGTLISTTAEADFAGETPTRLADTRQTGTLHSGNTLPVNVGTTNPVALNITAASATGPGHLIVGPCGTPNTTSSVNFNGPAPVANMALTAPDNTGRICIKAAVANNGTVDVIVDRTGTFTDNTFTANPPSRLADTRRTGNPLAAGRTHTLTGFAPNTAQAINLTTVLQTGPGHLIAYPCNEGRPSASNSNYQPGIAKASLTVVKADQNGRICVWTHTTVHLIVDHYGTFDTDGTEFFAANRVLDSRAGRTHIGIYNYGRYFQTTFPNADGRAVVLNVTAATPGAGGHLTVYPCGTNPPTASTLNYQTGQVVPNGVIITPNNAGQVCFYSHAGINLIVDHAGYVGHTTTPEPAPTTTTPEPEPAPTTTTPEPEPGPCDTEYGTEHPHTTNTAVTIQDRTQAFVDCLNERRATANINPVAACDTLTNIAIEFAADASHNAETDIAAMHSIDTARTSYYAYTEGYDTYWTVTDNVLMSSPFDLSMHDAVNDAWANSPGHEWQQMRSAWNTVGMAAAWNTDTGMYHYVAVFGEDTTC